MTTFDAEVGFRQWSRFVPRAQRAQRPARIEDTEDIFDRWLYVFSSSGSEAPLPLLEIFVKSSEELTPMPIAASDAPRPDPNTQSTSTTVKLALTAAARLTYRFFLSRIRLSGRALDALTADAAQLLPSVDIADSTQLVFDGARPGLPLVPVLDPLFVAEQLDESYVLRASRLVEFLAKPAGQASVAEVSAKRFVGGILERVLRGDPQDKLQLRGHFEGGPETMRNDLDALRRREDALTRDMEASAATLTAWLSSPLVAFVMKSYEDDEQNDYPTLIDAIWRSTRRLSLSNAGKAFLGKLVNSGAHFIEHYVLPQSNPTELKASVATRIQKFASKMLDLWLELGPPVLSSMPYEDAIKRLGEGFNRAFGATNPGVPRLVFIGRDFAAGITTIQLNEVAVKSKASWAPWVQNIDAFAKALNRCAQIYLIAKSLGKALDDKQTPFVRIANGMSVVSGSLGLTSSLTELAGEDAATTLKQIGTFGAIFGVTSSTLQAVNAETLDDGNAALGHAISAVGAGLTLAAMCTSGTIVGLGAGAVLGVAGAVVGAAGWLTSFLGADSPLQTVVSHCFWGEDFGSGSGALPWTRGALSAWKQRPDHMMSALLDVLFAFSVTDDVGASDPEIRLGVSTANAKVRMLWTSVDNHRRKLTVEHVFDLATRSASVVSSSEAVRAGTPKARFSPAGAGRPASIAVAAPRRQGVPGELLANLFDTKVEVQLLLDDSSRIPSSGKLVPFVVERSDFPNLTTTTVNSLDF